MNSRHLFPSKSIFARLFRYSIHRYIYNIYMTWLIPSIISFSFLWSVALFQVKHKVAVLLDVSLCMLYATQIVNPGDCCCFLFKACLKINCLLICVMKAVQNTLRPTLGLFFLLMHDFATKSLQTTIQLAISLQYYTTTLDFQLIVILHLNCILSVHVNGM